MAQCYLQFQAFTGRLGMYPLWIMGDYCTHILFTHLSINGYLVCFYLLAIVNSAAVSTGSLMFYVVKKPIKQKHLNLLLQNTSYLNSCPNIIL